MRRTLIIIFGCCAAMTAVMLGQPQAYRDRWVYVSTGLDGDQELARVEGIARTASEHGINGILLSAGFDSMDLKSPESLSRLTRLKQTCDRLDVEIIPAGFGVGYGGGVMSHDKNLAAGQPVRGALFVAGEHEAHFARRPAGEDIAMPTSSNDRETCRRASRRMERGPPLTQPYFIPAMPPCASRTSAVRKARSTSRKRCGCILIAAIACGPG